MLGKIEYGLELCDDDLKTAKVLFDNSNFYGSVLFVIL